MRYSILFGMSKSVPKTVNGRSQNELEVMAALFGVKKFRSFLLGRRFTLIHDHANLPYYLRNQHLQNWHMQRWLAELSTFDMDLVHMKAKHLLLEDILGRIAEFQDDPKFREDHEWDSDDEHHPMDVLNRIADRGGKRSHKRKCCPRNCRPCH